MPHIAVDGPPLVLPNQLDAWLAAGRIDLNQSQRRRWFWGRGAVRASALAGFRFRDLTCISPARGSVLQCARKAQVVVTPALDTCFVAPAAASRALLLRPVAGTEQKQERRRARPTRRPVGRGSGSAAAVA
jgi:hypothetical protein